MSNTKGISAIVPPQDGYQQYRKTKNETHN